MYSRKFKQPEQGALARPTGADDPEDLTRVDLQRGHVDDAAAPVAVLHAGQLVGVGLMGPLADLERGGRPSW